jgi:ankyrin repeat protein
MSDETPTGRQCDDQLLKAIDKNDIAEVRRLLESGVCPNGRRNSDPDLSPLTKAVRLGRLEIMSILFQHKVKPGVDELGHTDIHLAVSNGDAVVLQTLLYYWKDEGYQLFNPTFSENPVHTTAEAGNLECLKLFQAAGLDISYTDRFLGMATLHYACQCKHARGADVVRYLLESGAADVNVVTKLEQESLLWYTTLCSRGWSA